MDYIIVLFSNYQLYYLSVIHCRLLYEYMYLFHSMDFTGRYIMQLLDKLLTMYSVIATLI